MCPVSSEHHYLQLLLLEQITLHSHPQSGMDSGTVASYAYSVAKNGSLCRPSSWKAMFQPKSSDLIMGVSYSGENSHPWAEGVTVTPRRAGNWARPWMWNTVPSRRECVVLFSCWENIWFSSHQPGLSAHRPVPGARVRVW